MWRLETVHCDEFGLQPASGPAGDLRARELHGHLREAGPTCQLEEEPGRSAPGQRGAGGVPRDLCLLRSGGRKRKNHQGRLEGIRGPKSFDLDLQTNRTLC